MPRLRILAGPSLSDLKEIRANSGQAAHIATDAFEGDVAVYIKNFVDTDGDVPESVYFEERKDVTWSIQVRGACLYLRMLGCAAEEMCEYRSVLARAFGGRYTLWKRV